MTISHFLPPLYVLSLLFIHVFKIFSVCRSCVCYCTYSLYLAFSITLQISCFCNTLQYSRCISCILWQTVTLQLHPIFCNHRRPFHTFSMLFCSRHFIAHNYCIARPCRLSYCSYMTWFFFISAWCFPLGWRQTSNTNRNKLRQIKITNKYYTNVQFST